MMSFCSRKGCCDGASLLADDEVTSAVAASADSDDGGHVVCGCRGLPRVDVRGPVSHHAPSHVWPLSGGYWGLHPDSCQSPGGT